MKTLAAIAGLAIVVAGAHAARAQTVPDLKGTWIPTDGAHIVDGQTRHNASGTEPAAGGETLQRHTSKFVFRIEGQDGRTFWGPSPPPR